MKKIFSFEGLLLLIVVTIVMVFLILGRKIEKHNASTSIVPKEKQSLVTVETSDDILADSTFIPKDSI